MQITVNAWAAYIESLRKVHAGAAALMTKYLETHDWWLNEQTRQEAVAYAYAISTRYGEAATAVACDFFDTIALDSLGASAVPAVPAATASYGEVAKAVYGTMKTDNVVVIAGAVERLVKLAGVDTVMENAIRDGAEWAWIPRGDTCAFCIALASRGWQRASRTVMRGGHAEHIHAHCDCTFAIRFDGDGDVEGYEPQKYLRMYYDAPLDGDKPTGKNRINAMRRQMYADHGTEEAFV